MAAIPNPLGDTFYMDNNLDNRLNDTKDSLLKDEDRVFIVDGGEGVGKSVFAFQIAAKVDPEFDLSRVCMTPEEFVKAVETAKPYQAVVFDEAFTGLSSRNSLSKVNNILVSLMMEMRQKNLFVIIVMPSVFFLERYVVLHRSTGLFHVYKHSGKRGRWIYFNKDKLKYLYLQGKKFLTYTGDKIPNSNFKGRFYEQYTINEAAYRKKKLDSLKDKSLELDKFDKYTYLRNKLFLCVYKEFNLTQEEMSKMFLKYKIKISQEALSQALDKASREFSK